MLREWITDLLVLLGLGRLLNAFPLSFQSSFSCRMGEGGCCFLKNKSKSLFGSMTSFRVLWILPICLLDLLMFFLPSFFSLSHQFCFVALDRVNQLRLGAVAILTIPRLWKKFKMELLSHSHPTTASLMGLGKEWPSLPLPEDYCPRVMCNRHERHQEPALVSLFLEGCRTMGPPPSKEPGAVVPLAHWLSKPLIWRRPSSRP